MQQVVVGMSGGIDSFVTALLLQEQGYEVIGVTLELWEEADVAEVKKICAAAGIFWYLQEGKELFRRQVVDPFIEGYISGQTPSPCCTCNSFVKWKLLKDFADRRGIPYIATGHYVRISRQDDRYYIRQGIDPVKDQSYFLWNISQDILSRALTPLGDYTKVAVKAWALARGYSRIADRKESMGICFLGGKNYREFIRQYRPGDERIKAGKIVDREGICIGQHEGIVNYTIGQKQGVPVREGRTLYVAGVDPLKNIIRADVKSALYTQTLEVEQLNIVDPSRLQAGNITVKIRGLGMNPEGYAKIIFLAERKVKVILSQPAWAVAPGQPIAFYQEDVLLGGGIAK